MEKARIDDPALDIPAVCEHLWQIIGNLGIVRNRALIVPGTQALHHVLPDLVPPMDRAWTGAFFLWSAAAPKNAQVATFTPDVHRAGAGGPRREGSRIHRKGWRTSRPKVLDNAIIGYSMLNEIACIRT